ncbi:hypothetical protein BDP27DRAFT_346801 [Rhodocollybia butyracea]|uniref:Uncharacterized protein n=1 Tax=Rhodocollybia butyracea TaxID=206335 RepID=A0A9P5QBP3_9AGAR|nr:hypothetical protein BDP27DRAFT_346801 [Rhodocollybia butyracea]
MKLVRGYCLNANHPQVPCLSSPNRVEHKDIENFRKYAKENAQSWFSYAHTSGAQSLYLVTGCDKVRAWGMACFSDAVYGQVHLEFLPRAVDNTARPIYWFFREDYAATQSGTDSEFKNQCVFLRGLKIALRKKTTGFQEGC